MLRFFRKIRQSLIESASIKKYLIYAVGEIVLVMIGILLALYVNNWNNENQEKKKVGKYLQEIKNNLRADNLLVDSIAIFNQRKNLNLLKSIEYYYKWESNEDYRDSLMRLLIQGDIAQIAPYKPVKTGMDALLSSGDLNLVSDSLRILLSEYYESADSEKMNNERVISLTRNQVQDKLLKKVASRKYIGQYAGLELPAHKATKNTTIIDNDLPVDMMFIIAIESERITTLKSLQAKGQTIIGYIDKNPL